MGLHEQLRHYPRAFAFLQGPPGPLFRMLADEMERRGIAAHRINLCGGDRLDWPDAECEFTGRFADWPLYFDRFLRAKKITDLLLYGDCRPYHVAAHGIARMRGVRIHVLEEGYLRPNWMTLEPDGVNGHSTLPRDPAWFLEQAKSLPPVPDLPPITASFARRARDSYWHYHYVVTGRLRFRHFRTHRQGSIIKEGIGWAWKFSREKARSAHADDVIARLHNRRFFVFPLQLSGDFQIRTHSPFADMRMATSFVVESFADFAPDDAHLVVKAHPMEVGFSRWHSHVKRLAREHGIERRLHYIDGGDLAQLSADAAGMVCVNSTSATLALVEGTPVCTLGDAIYDIDGITHQGHLDSFWTVPTPPDPAIYDAFRRVLLARCLVRGGLASQSAIDILIKSMLERLELAALPATAPVTGS